jgi:hypothetical protein
MVRLKHVLTTVIILTTIGLQGQTKKLIHGNTFNGYAYTAEGGRVEPSQLFRIQNGTVYLSGDKPGYLMGKVLFADFELTMEYRWNDAETKRTTTKRNSGVMYHIPAEAKDTLWPQGIQFQIKDNATGDFVLLQNTTLSVDGKLQGPGKSVVVKRSAGDEKPSGEWNSIKIVAKGQMVEQYLNNVLVNKGEQSSVSKGRILFQYEGCPIEFRNIKIARLKKK